MHNMAASAAIPTDSLRSPSFTQRVGTTYSIMDYARNNYVAQPGDKERGVRLTPPDLGLYDYFTIKWLYTPLLDVKTSRDELPILREWITEKSGDPIYRYGKQQIFSRFDPSSVEEDLGDDPGEIFHVRDKEFEICVSEYEYMGRERRSGFHLSG